MIETICPVCGKTYLADPKRLKWGRQTTCSKECSYELRGKNRRNNDTHTCQVCGKVFARKPFQVRAKLVTVCSAECYKQARRSGLVTPKPPEKEPIEYDCEQCGKHVVIPAAIKGARRFRFCSAECANIWGSGSNNPAWRGGYLPYYGANWQRQRRRARKRDNYTCQNCGVTEKELGKQLDVHHLVRFASFDTPEKANVLSNLICLCHTCHLKREWNDFPDLR